MPEHLPFISPTPLPQRRKPQAVPDFRTARKSPASGRVIIHGIELDRAQQAAGLARNNCLLCHAAREKKQKSRQRKERLGDHAPLAPSFAADAGCHFLPEASADEHYISIARRLRRLRSLTYTSLFPRSLSKYPRPPRQLQVKNRGDLSERARRRQLRR
ncbi:hypothetical protein SKAU_G00379400 [Synaphobranchus kaupii]|uniref:Uncharacterized protein n=1 Tax=Synaphobranchus kaupii TaxID=118154 RepID=A0A9Q1IDN4_SYNKA|nr:hypothetical protein SKAU_G00379400 [Synaphobranchus kaupii]